jgi:membrane-associated PAP2 superfamily phosphatase
MKQADSQPPAPQKKDRSRPPLLWPLAVLALLTLLLYFTEIEIAIADFFFTPGPGFVGRESLIGKTLHESCSVIVAVVALGSLIVLIGARWIARLRSQRVGAAFLLLAMLVGPGIIVNFVFKGHFGRPRPFQVERYGGPYAYQKVGVPSSIDGAESFPSGDASIGAFLAMPAFVLWRQRRRLAWRFLGLGLAAWLTMGLSRIVMGAHWASDILWSAGFVYLTGHLIFWLFFDVGKGRPVSKEG